MAAVLITQVLPEKIEFVFMSIWFLSPFSCQRTLDNNYWILSKKLSHFYWPSRQPGFLALCQGELEWSRGSWVQLGIWLQPRVLQDLAEGQRVKSGAWKAAGGNNHLGVGRTLECLSKIFRVYSIVAKVGCGKWRSIPPTLRPGGRCCLILGMIWDNQQVPGLGLVSKLVDSHFFTLWELCTFLEETAEAGSLLRWATGKGLL